MRKISPQKHSFPRSLTLGRAPYTQLNSPSSHHATYSKQKDQIPINYIIIGNLSHHLQEKKLVGNLFLIAEWGFGQQFGDSFSRRAITIQLRGRELPI